MIVIFSFFLSVWVFYLSNSYHNNNPLRRDRAQTKGGSAKQRCYSSVSSIYHIKANRFSYLFENMCVCVKLRLESDSEIAIFVRDKISKKLNPSNGAEMKNGLISKRTYSLGWGAHEELSEAEAQKDVKWAIYFTHVFIAFPERSYIWVWVSFILARFVINIWRTWFTYNKILFSNCADLLQLFWWRGSSRSSFVAINLNLNDCHLVKIVVKH